MFLGICIPNLGRFPASNNLAKIENVVKYLYRARYHHIGHLPSKYQLQNSSQRGNFFSSAPILGPAT